MESQIKLAFILHCGTVLSLPDYSSLRHRGQTFFTKGRNTVRIVAAGRMRIENRYKIFRILLIRIERNK